MKLSLRCSLTLPISQICSKAFSSDDPVIRMRVADAVEKISAQRAELLQPFKKNYWP
jgi:hypothetical protein